MTPLVLSGEFIMYPMCQIKIMGIFLSTKIYFKKHHNISINLQ